MCAWKVQSGDNCNLVLKMKPKWILRAVKSQRFVKQIHEAHMDQHMHMKTTKQVEANTYFLCSCSHGNTYIFLQTFSICSQNGIHECLNSRPAQLSWSKMSSGERLRACNTKVTMKCYHELQSLSERRFLKNISPQSASVVGVLAVCLLNWGFPKRTSSRLCPAICCCYAADLVRVMHSTQKCPAGLLLHKK